MKSKLLISTLLFLQCTFATLVYGKEKPRIALLDFRDEACKIENLGKLGSNKISDEFVKLGRVDVIDRATLVALLQEQKLDMTDIMDTSSAVEAGRILGINYLVFGEVTQGMVSRGLQTRKMRENKKDIEKKVWEYTGMATVQLKVVDVKSAKIIFSGTRSEKRSEDEEVTYEKEKEEKEGLKSLAIKKLLSIKEEKKERNVKEPETNENETHAFLVREALGNACNWFDVDLYNLFRLSGYVIKVDKEKKKIVIDLGRVDGVKKGNKFILVEKGEPIIHPVTKEEIPGEEVKIGEVKIKEVSENSSSGKVKKKVIKKVNVGTIVNTKEKKGGSSPEGDHTVIGRSAQQ